MNVPNVYYCHAYNSERIKVKTCTCGNGQKSCPSHTYSSRSIGDGYYIEGSNSQINNTSSSNENTNTSSENQSDISECTVTIQANYETPIPDELKLSLTSLVTDNSDEKAKDRKLSYEKWLAEKNQQKREQELDRLEIEERILLENKQKLFLERDNFKRWLENKIALQKTKEEEVNKRKLEEEKRKLQEQEKKEELNKKIYKLWLKKKESEELAKKLKEQERKLQEVEEKKKRMQMNAEAFQDWMKNSVHKPKPVPLNRGLESLRSSVSVSYINPVPWTPNIQEPMKNNLAGQFKYNRQIY